MQKKSFHKTLLVVDKQRVKCERTFFLSYFLYKIEIAVTGMFRFAEKMGQDLAEGIQSDILNTLGVYRFQLFRMMSAVIFSPFSPPSGVLKYEATVLSRSVLI